MEYLSPAVYIEEVDSGPKPIEGVSTSTAGFIGRTVRGPVTGLPLLVTSFPDFRRQFGGYLPANSGNSRFLAHAINGFFANGGKRCYVRRVVNADNSTVLATSTAGVAPVGGFVTRLAQNALSGSNLMVLTSLRRVADGAALTLRQVVDGVVTTQNVTVAANGYNSATNTVTLTANLTSGYDRRFTSVTVGAAGATAVVFQAADPGRWGNDITLQLFAESVTSGQFIAISNPTFDIIRLSSASSFYVGAIVEFDRGQTKAYRRVTAINGNSITVMPPFAAATDLNPNGGGVTMARSCEFRVSVSYEGVVEQFTGLSLNSATSRYYVNIINTNSSLIRVTNVADNAATDPFTQPSGADGLNVTLAGGSDGNAPTAGDYIGSDNGPGQRSGLQSLVDIDVVSILAVPGITDPQVQNAMIVQCTTLLDRFAVLDPTYSINSALIDIQNQGDLFDTKYAALYFPRLIGFDPTTGNDITLPPSGHVIGLYAKTDNERGVHKAPANVALLNVSDLEVTVNKGEHDILNPRNINVIRDLRADRRGIRVMGARCLTSDASWRYVPVRRLFLYVEESLNEGLQWVIFEPNDHRLWARVRQTISNFLIRVWRDGALMGEKPEQAFYVLCNLGITMTQDDIDNGRLIVEVAIAPVRPAEFVIIRIQQYTVEANVA
jgi:phage tail sheath protein FI